MAEVFGNRPVLELLAVPLDCPTGYGCAAAILAADEIEMGVAAIPDGGVIVGRLRSREVPVDFGRRTRVDRWRHCRTGALLEC